LTAIVITLDDEKTKEEKAKGIKPFYILEITCKDMRKEAKLKHYELKQSRSAKPTPSAEISTVLGDSVELRPKESKE
jgi:hypothetical protein